MVVSEINPYERQTAIWFCLCNGRQVTAEGLAIRFNTTVRTIYRDLQELMRTHPIESIPGKYGGYKLPDWYVPSRTRLCAEQVAALKRAIENCAEDDRKILTSILRQFEPP